LGCVAFEVLTGQPPFTGTQEELASQHLNAAAPTLAIDNPALEALVARLLNKDPAGRPQDARAVEERLERIFTPLTPLQVRLREAESVHATERSQEALEAAQRDAEGRQRVDLWRQAVADLRELFDDALVMLESALPDVESEAADSSFAMFTEDATLRLSAWGSPIDLPREDDPIAVAGEVNASNRRWRDPPPLANVAYVLTDGRMSWQLYRFRRNALFGGRYFYNISSGDHGFHHGDFMKERQYMRHPSVHVWSLRKSPLVADSVVELFAEASELSPGRA
jgi:hypothetical protein